MLVRDWSLKWQDVDQKGEIRFTETDFQINRVLKMSKRFALLPFPSSNWSSSAG